MSAIFAYIGDAPCKDLILEGLCCLKGERFELSGVSLKTEGKIETLKIKGSPEVLQKEAKDIGKNAHIGIGEAARVHRCKAAGITSVPASNKLFSVSLDGAIENFDTLKQWSKNPFPIATDEDLLLALLTKLGDFSPLETISKLSASLGGKPSYAFITSNEDAVYAKSGTFPLFVGICEDGFCLSSELNAAACFSKKYFIIERGEFCKITKEKITVYDSKFRKIKKQSRSFSHSEYLSGEYAFTSGVHSLSFALRDTVKEFVSDSALNFDYLKLGSRVISKIKRAVITGSGTSFRAARISAYNFEVMSGIPCSAIHAGELRYSGAEFDRETLLIALSISGEDRDTVACVRRAKASQAITLTVTGNSTSLLALECSRTIDLKIKSTPAPVCAYVFEVTAMSLFTLWFGAKNETISEMYLNVAVKLAELLTGKVSGALRANSLNPIPSNKIINSSRIFVTGLGADYELSHQAAAEIRNIVSRPAFAASCAELAAEGEQFFTESTVVAFITNRELMYKSLYYIRRIRSLGADVILFTTTGIESEINDFDNVVSVTESLPVFDTTVALAGLENTLLKANEIIQDEKQAG